MYPCTQIFPHSAYAMVDLHSTNAYCNVLAILEGIYPGASLLWYFFKIDLHRVSENTFHWCAISRSAWQGEFMHGHPQRTGRYMKEALNPLNQRVKSTFCCRVDWILKLNRGWFVFWFGHFNLWQGHRVQSISSRLAKDFKSFVQGFQFFQVC